MSIQVEIGIGMIPEAGHEAVLPDVIDRIDKVLLRADDSVLQTIFMRRPVRIGLREDPMLAGDERINIQGSTSLC